MADIPRVARWRQRNREAGKQALTIWLTTDDKTRLLDMAQQQHTSPSAIITAALAQYQPTRPVASTDADTVQIRLLIQEILSDQLPRRIREVMAAQGHATETDTDTVTDTPSTDTVTEPVTEPVTETPAHPDLAEEVLEMLTGVTYDTSRYKLGKLCRRGHDYEGTG